MLEQGLKGRPRIGTSGYQYDHWRGVFYPQEMRKAEWFAHYAEQFDTVEINNTFYHLPAASAFDDWHDRAPSGFRYALKFSRYGTHLKKLRDPADSIGNFVERADRLQAYLGPVLVQLPPKWKAEPDRLRAFLDAAPKRVRWAIEFRDESWLCKAVFKVLRDAGAALCIHDLIDDHPREVTADFVYLRYHGNHYQGSYAEDFLAAEADHIAGFLDRGLDVYAYFNNDQKGYAVKNATFLKRRLSGE